MTNLTVTTGNDWISSYDDHGYRSGEMSIVDFNIYDSTFAGGIFGLYGFIDSVYISNINLYSSSFNGGWALIDLSIEYSCTNELVIVQDIYSFNSYLNSILIWNWNILKFETSKIEIENEWHSDL